eukprot:CAMPEP_0185030138 /NCGR_PEP_ID=MMETSP1103-20130426/16918_1 /TAXON_ID=36769 /ORGANISM="Paraphysomonas bandaiensis, Strain Caron Lab Isolate" /LENGTH=812 /DNA_ID=CAMNT_0027565135 /DNA_START=122 /DNA_END=2560 /DNA_ORIENTATION=+
MSSTGIRRARSIVHTGPRYIFTNRKLFQPSSVGFFERLLSIPRGFKKFYPKQGDGAKGSKGDSASKSSEKVKSSWKKKGSNKGSGGGGNKDNDPFGDLWGFLPLIVGTGAVAAILYRLESSLSGNEISWQEFQSQYLEPGLVERVVVVNKSIAKVALKHPDRPYTDSAQVRQSEENIFPSRFRKEEEEDSSAFHVDAYEDSNDPHQSSVGPVASGRSGPSRFVRDPFFIIGSVDSFERKMDEAQARLSRDPKDHVQVIYQTEPEVLKELVHLIPTFVIMGILFMTFRSMGGSSGGGPMGNIFKVGKSNAKIVKKEDMKVTFKDVAGCDEAKKEVMEFVEFLRGPERFQSLGAKIPRGALLAGPPGTGKTLLAKATAGEADVPFFSMSGSDFVEMFVGVGASRVRDLFKEARANAPCIVFIDEIDAVGRARGKGGQGGHDERENTLNQLLIEMDGFNTDENVILLAGTNRADMLDSALTRPGRFDRTIAVELPDIKGRKAIFDVHLKNIKLAGPLEEFSPRLAALTPGFSGADIANICNEAAIHAGRENKKSVDMIDFEMATDRVIGGLESTRIISPEERRIVAYHEAGHAVAGWYLEHASPLLKVTIVPRSKGSLGYAQYLPKEISLRTKEQVMDIVCMALAGRAAEQVHFGKYTTGASDDLRKVTQIMYELVQVYGMNSRVGQLAFPKQDTGWPQDKVYSEATAEVMDEEVRALAEEAFQRTLDLMEKYKADVERVAELLLKQETISHSDVAELIGDRKFSAGKEYDEFVSMKKSLKETDERSGKDVEEKSKESEETKEDAGAGGVLPGVA